MKYKAIDDLTVNFRWYQPPPDYKKNDHSFFISGPMSEWKGDIYCELINNPRLIAKKINIMFPVKNPTQGTWDSPEIIIAKLPSVLKERVRLVDKDLYINNIASKILLPIKNDLNIDDNIAFSSDNSHYSFSNDIITDLNNLQSMLRNTIISIEKQSMCDVSNGLWSLSNLLLQIDFSILSDESKFRLNVLKNYYENYYRMPSGPILTLKPIGPNISAPELLEELCFDEEYNLIISEKNKLNQCRNITKYYYKRFLSKYNKFRKNKEQYIDMTFNTSTLFPYGNNLAKINDNLKNIGIPQQYIPLLNLDNSRMYAIIKELNSFIPVYTFYNGSLHIHLNNITNKGNFAALMNNTLSLREQQYIRLHELEKKDMTLDLSKGEVSNIYNTV